MWTVCNDPTIVAIGRGGDLLTLPHIHLNNTLEIILPESTNLRSRIANPIEERMVRAHWPAKCRVQWVHRTLVVHAVRQATTERVPLLRLVNVGQRRT